MSEKSTRKIVVEDLDTSFRDEVAAVPGGENIKKCFACGTCAAGCPVTNVDEEYNSRKIIRQVLLGLRDEVLKPIKFSQGGLSTLRTDNTDKITDRSGKPFGSHGLFYIYDDVAKLSKFLNNDGGKADNIQILDPTRLRDSLFRNPDSLGLPISGPKGIVPETHRYQSAFWGTKMTRAEFPGVYGCDVWVARMGGYGGISIVLMPNGVTYYVFSDNDEFLWHDAVREANKLAPFCKEQPS